MAKMIPDKPHEFNPASQEGLMFEALNKLSEDYYVFHSFKITTVSDNILFENEIDFVVFNRRLGVVCLEAKAGQVKYENGYWYYGNGIPMYNGGPFNQASSNKYKLIKYIENSNLSKIIPLCKFLHAVWFPSVSNVILESMILPSEADKSIIMTKEALKYPELYLIKIFNTQLPNGKVTNLSENDADKLIREIFCPRFNIFPTASYDNDLKKIVFHRLLREQANILNYLEDQKTAIINGAAGTGKTMIAVEKAKRHATQGEKVLFLCFNARLRLFLTQNYSHDLISYYTISGLACKMCNTLSADYKKFKSILEDFYLSETFPYQHVIIDEGQDFGVDDIEESDIIMQVKDIIVDNEKLNGTFYVFYDKLQLIQAHHMPKFIEDSDCKLTLYRNCRNTENIAKTSLRPITERKPILFEGSVKGIPAKIHFCATIEAETERINQVLEICKSTGFSDVVILTCKTEERSILSSSTKDGLYKNKYRFSTCRKFKGLEADAVILIDVDNETFNSENVLIYYVGTSRARIKLDVITSLNDDDCLDILRNKLNIQEKIKKPKKELASALNAIGNINE